MQTLQIVQAEKSEDHGENRIMSRHNVVYTPGIISIQPCVIHVLYVFCQSVNKIMLSVHGRILTLSISLLVWIELIIIITMYIMYYTYIFMELHKAGTGMNSKEYAVRIWQDMYCTKQRKGKGKEGRNRCNPTIIKHEPYAYAMNDIRI